MDLTHENIYSRIQEKFAVLFNVLNEFGFTFTFKEEYGNQFKYKLDQIHVSFDFMKITRINEIELTIINYQETLDDKVPRLFLIDFFNRMIRILQDPVFRPAHPKRKIKIEICDDIYDNIESACENNFNGAYVLLPNDYFMHSPSNYHYKLYYVHFEGFNHPDSFKLVPRTDNIIKVYNDRCNTIYKLRLVVCKWYNQEKFIPLDLYRVIRKYLI